MNEKSPNDLLGLAASYGNFQVILRSIELGADDWNIGLKRASECGNLKLVEFFIEKGANELNKGMYEAVKKGNTQLVEFFLNKPLQANDLYIGLRMAKERCFLDIMNLFYKQFSQRESEVKERNLLFAKECNLKLHYSNKFINIISYDDIINFCKTFSYSSNLYETLYATSDDIIVGFLSFKKSKDGYIKIQLLCTRNKKCPKGVGTFLITEFEKFAKSNEFIKIILTPHSDAVPFYLNLGYRWDLFKRGKLSKII